MKKLFVIVPTLLLFWLPGTSCFGETAEKYYPLKEGKTWVYSISSEKQPVQKITVTNLAPREINGMSVTLRKWEVSGGVRYYLVAQDDYGVYRYGEQQSETAEPKIITPKVYYLKNPVDKGTNWDISTKLGEDDLKVNVTIDGIRDQVQVPAGSYNDCVKAKHEGGGQFSGKDGGDLSLTAYEWYAPDVGLVKSMVTIKKKAKDGKISSESITYQLESFKP